MMSILLAEAQNPEGGLAQTILAQVFPREHLAYATTLVQVGRLLTSRNWDLIVVGSRICNATALDVLALLPSNGSTPSVILLSRTGADPIDMEMLNMGFHNLVIADESGIARLPQLAQRVLATARQEEERNSRSKDLDGFFTLSLEMLCILDMHAVFLRVNPAFGLTLGFSAQELATRNLFELVHPDDRTAFHVEWKKLSEGQLGKPFSIRVQRKNLSFVHLLWNASPVPDRGLIYAAARDESGNVEARRELRFKEAQYHGMVDHIPFAIFGTNAEGIIQMFNKTAESVFGYRQTELFGVRFDRLFEEGCLKEIPFMLNAALKQSQTHELKARTQTGMLFPVVLYLDCFQIGRKNLFLGMIRKARTTKYMEKEAWVAQHNNYRAHQTESMKVVASSIAHDFSNHLSPIIGYTEIALSDLPPGHPAQSSLGHVMAASYKARNAIETIYTRGKRGLASGPIDIERAVHDALAMIEGLCPEHMDVFSKIDTFSGYTVMAETSMITLLMLNLAQNCFEAIGERSGRLDVVLTQVKLQPREITGAFHLKEGSYALLKVSDDGPGVERDQLECLCRPFFTQKHGPSHLGMGLTIAQKIAKRLGGEMVIESGNDLGLTTKIYLPLQKQAIGEHRRLKLLVVDDEREVTKMLKEVLERYDYDVTTCHSGREALELFRENVDFFDLVITDQRMPDISGTRIAAVMTHLRTNLPVVLISGYGGEELENDLSAAGIYQYLMKPVSTRTLLEVIKEATKMIG